MSVTSQPTTFSDLFVDLQNRVRATTGVTATENQAKRYINSAMQDIALATRYKLPWLERRAVLRTHDDYTTGTVDVSIGATAVVGTSSLWATANNYGENNARTAGKMTFAGGSDVYKITTVGSDTSITLTDRWVGTAALAAATYIYFEDEYALASDFLRPLDFQIFSDSFNLPLVSRLEFRRRYPRPNVSGRPRVATILDIGFGATTTPVRRVQFYPYPDAVYLIPYSYITSNLAVSATGVEAANLSADLDEPTMPLMYRHLIVLHALMNWYRDKRDDARSQEVKQEYTDGMLRLLGDQEIGTHMKAQFQPKVGVYQNTASRPYSKRIGSRWSINNEFDRFEV